MKEKIIINNIVATFDVNCSFDLNKISNQFEDVVYDPEMYYAAILKHKNPKFSYLINSSGKIIINGLKKIHEVSKYALAIVKELSIRGYNVKFKKENLKIVNIVSGFTSNKSIRLDLFAKKIDCEYNPDKFPGLIYKIGGGKVLIFSTGKFQFVGYTTLGQIELAKKKLMSLLKTKNLITSL